MNPIYAMFFDRNPDKIDGVLTLQRTLDDITIKVFDKLPARSGQKGHTGTDWEQGESPMPFGRLLIRTKAVPLQMDPRGTPFFPICSDARKPGIISDGYHTRTNCGLHLENKFPGTAGCVALVIDTKAQEVEAYALFHFLESLQSLAVFLPFTVT